MSEANKRQVGGEHYSAGDKPQHWDIVAMHDLDYFQGQITKYVMRWKKKNGLQDLHKAAHFLQKYIELNSPKPQEVMKRELLEDKGLITSAGFLSDMYFQAEGGWGDGTQLYTCRTCRARVRAADLVSAAQSHAQPCQLPHPTGRQNDAS